MKMTTCSISLSFEHAGGPGFPPTVLPPPLPHLESSAEANPDAAVALVILRSSRLVIGRKGNDLTLLSPIKDGSGGLP